MQKGDVVTILTAIIYTWLWARLCQKFYVHKLISQHTWKVVIMPIIKMRSKVLAMSIVLLEAVDLALNSRLLTFKASLYFPYQDPLFSAMERLIKKKFFFFISMHFCPHLWGFPDGSDGKESAYNAGKPGSIPGSGRSPGEGNGYPFQYSCLENPMDRGAWWATVHGVTKSWTWQVTSTFCNNPSKWQ